MTRALPLALAFLAGCADGFLQEPDSGLLPVRIEIRALGGAALEATVEEPVHVRARVTDPFGRPAAGILVGWEVVEGGGRVEPDAGHTDANGVATATWTLGPVPGPGHALVASAAGKDARFRATALPAAERAAATP